ncbi:MAG: hypothetical protein V3575_02425 [Candidatus Absconditabacteria bacterium]
MSNTYEIEIKVLLGSEEKAKSLIEKMHKEDGNINIKDSSNQLNHYFLRNGDFQKLYEKISNYIESAKINELHKILFQGKNHSIRTREANGKVIFVVKAVADDTNAENGIARLEFEAPVKISLQDLDSLILESGFEYQSKWSRNRVEYNYKDFVVCIDKNAGYGYLAEFEKVINDFENIQMEKDSIVNELAVLGLEELQQDRLDRMFKYYNQNWPHYYGTNKTFNIE